MHIFATGTYVLCFSLVSKKFKKLYVPCVIGTVGMTVSMVLWNIFLTPIFLGTALNEVLPIIVTAVIPFNIIKAGLNSIFALLLYSKTQKKLDEIFRQN